MHKNKIYRNLLNEKMSSVSEDFWCAGWYTGIEYHLWGAIEHYRNGRESFYGNENAEVLELLSQEADGWWVYTKHDGEQFVELPEWIKLYEEWKSTHEDVYNWLEKEEYLRRMRARFESLKKH